MALDFQIENGMLIKWSNGAQLTGKMKSLKNLTSQVPFYKKLLKDILQ